MVLEIDGARSEVPGLHRGHLGCALAARARDRVVHAHGNRSSLYRRLVREAQGVHELRLLKLLDQGLESFERQAQAGLESGAAQLIGESESAQKEAGDEVTADMEDFVPLGYLELPGLPPVQK